jgi:ABC-type dipeptide/oligopeptide/nickel transport system permease subunit
VLLVLLGVALVGLCWEVARGVPAASLQSDLAHASAGAIARWWMLATRNAVGLLLLTTLVAALLGTALGALSVYAGGVGGGLFRLIEFTGAVPALVLVGVLRFADRSGGVLSLLGALALVRTFDVAQLVRAQVLRTLPSDFVEASRALGASRRWQLRVHVAPRLIRPLLVNLLVGGASLIGLEAALSFTGLGMPADVPSWGGGLRALTQAPSVALTLCVVASITLTSATLYALGAQLAAQDEPSASPLGVAR